MSTTSPWQYSSSSSSSIIRSSCSSISVHPLIFANRKRALFTSYAFPHVHYTTLCCGAGSSYAKEKSEKKVTGGENLVTVGKIANLPKKKNKQNKLLNVKLKSLFGRRALWRRIFFASKKVRSIILLNVITLVYASDIPVLKEVEAIIDPATFTVVRFVVSAIPFLPFAWRSWDDVETRNSGIELGFWVSLGYLTQALGLLTSDAGRASFISMFTVIVVPLIDGMLGSVIPTRTWFGALMSIIGVGMLECSGSPPCVGDLFNFLSALFFGIHMLRTEHISRKTDKQNFLPVLAHEVCIVALSSIIWFVIGGATDGSLEYHPSSWTWEMFSNWFVEFPWVPALYTGVFSTGLCLWIEMTAMRDISATETAVIYGLEPVWGAGFAWFLLGERWGVSGWFGAALVLSGSLMVQIIGASSEKLDSSNNKEDIARLSNMQNGLSATPVPVSSKKDVSDLLKK
ncbi:eamA domain-containing protein [Artemisia annua]|uniref:EamA domain-containing protein n=1 Tax=Artemisia annua TaxID=35608 RepID=A0A2U1MSW3_ARTAN|nr:eamA domain-containing protein [Artemisia annua]